jgi:hypothetical protein
VTVAQCGSDLVLREEAQQPRDGIFIAVFEHPLNCVARIGLRFEALDVRIPEQRTQSLWCHGAPLTDSSMNEEVRRFYTGLQLEERQRLRDVIVSGGARAVEVRYGAGEAEDASWARGLNRKRSAAPARRSRASAVGAPSSRRRRLSRALL